MMMKCLRLFAVGLILVFMSCAGSGRGQADLYEEGKTLFEAGQYGGAEETLRDFLSRSEQDPREDSALLMLAKARIEQEAWNDAKSALDELILNYPTSPHLEEAYALLDSVRQEREPAPGDVADSNAVQATPTPESSAAKTAPDTEAAGLASYMKAMTAYKANPSENQRRVVKTVIDQRMNLSDLEQALALPITLSTDGFPAEALACKRVLLTMHLRQFDKAKTLAESFLNEHPDSLYKDRVKAVLADLAALQRVDTKTIGVVLPLSGTHKVYGERAKKAVDLALKLRLNEQGLRVVYVDSAGDGAGVAKAMRKLVMEDNVIGVVGPLLRKEAMEAAYAAEEYQLPLISLSSADGVPEVGSNVFRIATTPRQQAKALMDYEWDVRGHRAFGILYPMHPYGEEMTQAFWDEVRTRGGDVVAVERYEDGLTTFATPVKRLVGRYLLQYRRGGYGGARSQFASDYQWQKAREKAIKDLPPVVNFDALFIPDYAKAIGLLAPALAFEDIEVDTKRERDEKRIAAKRRRTGRDIKAVQLLGGNGWNHASLGETGGKYVEGAIFSDSYFVDGTTTGVRAYFAGNYDAEYRRNPSALEAHAFDAVLMMAEALKALPQTRNELRAALAGIRNFEGATGTLSFDLSGETQRTMMLLTIYEGKVRELNVVTEKMQHRQEELEKAGKVKTEDELVDEFENDQTPSQTVR